MEDRQTTTGHSLQSEDVKVHRGKLHVVNLLLRRGGLLKLTVKSRPNGKDQALASVIIIPSYFLYATKVRQPDYQSERHP